MKAMKQLFCILFFAILLFSCSNGTAKWGKTLEADYIEADTLCSTPQCVIVLQPYDNYTQKEAQQLRKVLKKKFLELYGVEFDFEVLPNKKFSADLMNDRKSRYRADKIIDSLKKEASDHKIMIGLTHKDVSVTYKGRPDWGVLGLSIHGTYACVVSDYRLKNKKRDYWKVVTHEFTHTAWNYGHCPNDDPTCIMKDAKGHGNFEIQDKLCNACKK